MRSGQSDRRLPFNNQFISRRLRRRRLDWPIRTHRASAVPTSAILGTRHIMMSTRLLSGLVASQNRLPTVASRRFLSCHPYPHQSVSSLSSSTRPTLMTATNFQIARIESCIMRQTFAMAVPRRNVASAAAPSTAQLLKELRGLSGAPMVDCKKALGETENDIEKALDWLRQHGVAKAAKKLSGREAEEGLVACSIADDGKSASIVKVSSETDFAGKSAAFVNLATHVANASIHAAVVGPIDPEAVLALESDSKSVKMALEEAIVAIRENLGIAAATKVTTEDGLLVCYVHGKADGKSNAGSAAAVVEIVGADDGSISDPQVAADAGKKVAMHIVASKPAYLDASEIPDDVLEKERAVLEGQIADSNKPPEVMEKIINGRMNKFYAEVCLQEQEHMVEEGNPKVSKALKQQGLAVKSFQLLFI